MNIHSTQRHLAPQLRLAQKERPVPPQVRLQEAADQFIGRAGNLVGTAFWGTVGTGVGTLAGAAASTLVIPELAPVLVGAAAIGGGIGAAVAYQKGHGDTMGLTAMACASVALGAGAGFLFGGSTGAVVGSGLGAAYAGAGLYLARDSY